MKKGRNEQLVLIVPDTCPSALPTPTLAPATETSSSPDMLESCLPERSPVDNLHNTTLTQRDVLCGVTMNVNQTFNTTAVNDSINFWDENLNLMSDEDSGSQKYLTFCNYSEGKSFNASASPFSAMKDSQMSSFDTFRRSSTENHCCSLSSGEIIVRNNGFCLNDQAAMVVSSPDESISATDGNGRLSAESNLLSITLPDISENSSENKGYPCLNMTFTPAVKWDRSTEENDVALSSSSVALPTESEGGLLMTFTCETSASCRQEEKLAGAEAELLPWTLSAVGQDQSKTVAIDSAVQKGDKSIYTSTPIQTIVDRRPNLHSFSESPFCESAGSMRVQVRRKQISVAPRPCAVAEQTPNKAKTMEIKKFPKLDYSKIKPKIVTRAMYQMTTPGSAFQHKAPQAEMNNKDIETESGAENEMTPAKVRKGATVVSTEPKTVDFGINTGAANVGAPLKEPSAFKEQVESRGSQSDQQPAADEHASAGQCSDATCENQQTASQQAGSDTAGLSTLKKSPDGCGQIGLQAVPEKVISSKNEVRSGSALGQNKPPVVAARPRCSSECSSVSQTPKEKKRTLKFSTSLVFPRGKTHQSQTKAGNVKCSSRRELATPAEDAEASAESSPGEVDKIGLVEEIGESTSGASRDDVKSRFRGKTPSQPTRGTLPLQAPVATPKPTPARLRLGPLRKFECRIPKAGATLPLKPKSSTGSPKVQSSLGTRSSASIRPQLNGSRRPQTPIRPSLIGPSLTPLLRPPCKTPGRPTGLTEVSKQSNSTSTQVCRGAAPKPTPLKSIVLKAKPFSTPARNTKPALTSACTPAASTNQTGSTFTPSLLKRSATARIVRPTSSTLVNKNKSRTGSRQQPPPPPASKPSQSNRPPGVVPPASVAEDERKDHIIQQLTGLLAASNSRFEALTIVLQRSLAERDEATKQCRELSQELVSLQGELVSSVNSSERLEKEKEGLRVTLEDAVHRVQDQHQKDLAELEQRLQAFYQAEWNKMHLAYQEEADKCSTVMEQQMGELEAKHEALKLQIETSHVEQLQSVKQQYEISLDELRQVHHQELQSLEKNLKEAEASLSVRIQQLTEENNSLLQKLTAVENRRKELAQKSEKDSHTLYLEQELESLKVVLDMKTTQLHLQEKKLMEIDKLTEKSLKLDEVLTKVQQENEDLKARMERHATLSRQLSTEQAVLQQSLQKESKVNKRLSMENEELLWKLNNDLSSPRKASPTSSSPSHSFSLQSPRSSSLLSSPPVSPR